MVAWSLVHDGGGGGGGGACADESAGEGTGPLRPETSAAASGGTKPCCTHRRCPQRTARPRGWRSYTSSPCDASDMMWTVRQALLPPLTPARRDLSRCESVSCVSRCSCLRSNCGSRSWVECQKLLASSQTCLRLTAADTEKQP